VIRAGISDETQGQNHDRQNNSTAPMRLSRRDVPSHLSAYVASCVRSHAASQAAWRDAFWRARHCAQSIRAGRSRKPRREK
jgi:hypothetical protein